MNRLKLLMPLMGIAVSLSFLVLCSSCGPFEPPPEERASLGEPKPPILSADQLRALENNVSQNINNYRQSKGLPTLTESVPADEIARQHSADMANGTVGFGHDGFDQRVRLVAQSFPGGKHYGENVFDIPSNYSTNLADSITSAWLRSPHHYKNIVGDYTDTGVGVSQNADGSIYVTQFFIQRDTELR